MERSPYTHKINFRKVARELDISATTLYRVLNHADSVKKETRQRVVSALNNYGYFIDSGNRTGRVVFDFNINSWLLRYGTELMQHLSIQDFHCTITDYRKNRERFLNAASSSDIVVFCSEPEQTIVDELRAQYPNVLTLSLFGHVTADITLTGNDRLGAQIGAEHLYRNGHRHIAVHTFPAHKDGIPRLRCIESEFKALSPECRVDHVISPDWQSTPQVWREYFATSINRPTAVFFAASSFSYWSRRCWQELDPELAGRLSAITYSDESSAALIYFDGAIDNVFFSIESIIEWAEYYINHRPLFVNRKPIVNLGHMTLQIAGSVKNLTGAKEAQI